MTAQHVRRIRRRLKAFFPLLVLALSAPACGGEVEVYDLKVSNTLVVRFPAATVTAGDSITGRCLRLAGGKEVPVTDALLLVNPAEGTVVSGMTLTANKAGQLQARCGYASGAAAESIPTILEVQPGPVAGSRVTFAEPGPAGVFTAARCEATDVHGNTVTADAGYFQLVAADTGLTISGVNIYGTRAGSYTVKCDYLPHPEEVQQPGTFEVVPGPAVRLEAALDPNVVVLEPAASVRVIGDAWDAYDNLIDEPGLLLNVTPNDGGLAVEGQRLRGVNQGRFTIQAQVVDAPRATDTLELIVDEGGPVVTIDSPDAASRLTGDAFVTVRGSATDSNGAVASLTVGGVVVTPEADGSFSADVPLEPGVNAVEVVAVDEVGLETRTVRWVLWSPEYLPLTKGFSDVENVPGGAIVRMGQRSVDDGVHDRAQPDDLATLLEIALGDLRLNQVFGGMEWVLTGDGSGADGDISYLLSVDAAQKESTRVALALKEGHLLLGLHLEGVDMDVTLEGRCLLGGFLDFCPDADLGEVTMDAATLTAQIIPYVDEAKGTVEFEVRAAKIEMDNLQITWTGTLHDLFGDLTSFLTNELRFVFDLFLNQALTDALPEALSGVLQAWHFDQTTSINGLFGGDDLDVRIEGGLTDINVTAQALELGLDTMVRDAGFQFSDSVGSYAAPACKPHEQYTDADLQFGLKDPVLNRLTHLLWMGGLLDYESTAGSSSALAQVCGLGDVVRLLGPDSTGVSVEIKPLLPPILNSCRGADEDYLYRMQLGGLQFRVNFRRRSAPVEMVFLAGFDAEVRPSADDELQLSVGDTSNVLVQVFHSAGLTDGDRADTVARIEAEAGAVIAEGMTQCLDGLLQLSGALDVSQLVPEAGEVSVAPVFERLDHVRESLFIEGYLD